VLYHAFYSASIKIINLRVRFFLSINI